jgi:hypothetical protein
VLSTCVHPAVRAAGGRGRDRAVGGAFSRQVEAMIRYKLKAVEKLLEERKPDLNLTTYQHIKKSVEQGADGLDPYTLSNICRDLQCLPTDIVEQA